MHSMGSLLPDVSVSGGTTLLVRGPTMTRKTDIVLKLLAGDDGPDTGTVLVTTDDAPADLWDRYRALAPDADPRRVGIVDATGDTSASGSATPSAAGDAQFSADGAGTPAVATVNSPADLTGIGMKTSRFFEELAGDGRVERLRLGVSTLNTMAMYADAERITRFVHAMGRRVAAAGGFGLVVVHSDGLEGDIGDQIPALVSGLLDVREGDGGVEVRPRSVGDDTGWRPVDLSDSRAATVRANGAGASAGSGPTAPNRDVDPPSSLAAAVHAVEDERPTLTLCNYDESDGGGTPVDSDELRSFFEARNVVVRVAALDTTTPRNVALLHRDETLLAASPVADLADAVAVDGASPFDSGRRPAVVEALSGDAHVAEGVGRAFLVEASRVVEIRAARTGGGRIDAGFQSLSRLWDVPRTRRIYEGLADAGVDVHAYGVGDVPTPTDTAITVHASDDPEIHDTWFVVHDGAGDDARMAALVAEERDPGTYHGFWTRTPDRVAALSTYVVEQHCH